MTWETPRKWVAGELMTAAKFNTVRNGLRFLHNKPTARVYNDANISVANNVIQTLTFNSEYYDTDSLHDTSTNPSRLTASIDGVYYLSACIGWASGSGRRVVGLRVNNTVYIGFQEYPSITSTQVSHSVSAQQQLTAGDYVEVIAYQNSGTSLNIEALNHTPTASIQWLGAGT